MTLMLMCLQRAYRTVGLWLALMPEFLQERRCLPNYITSHRRDVPLQNLSFKLKFEKLVNADDWQAVDNGLALPYHKNINTAT